MTIPVKLGKAYEAAATAQLVEVQNGVLTLTEPSSVYIDLSPLDVVSMTRDGSNLLLKTVNGDLLIENYFDVEAGQIINKLFVHDNGCQNLVHVKLLGDGAEENFGVDYEILDEPTPFETLTCPVAHLDPTVAALAAGASMLPLALIGGGALAALALINNDDDNDDDDDNPPPPLPNPQ